MMLLSAMIALASLAAATPQVTSIISPPSLPPSSCSSSYSSPFEIAVVAPAQKMRSTIAKRDVLLLSLSNSILKDKLGRTGYIAANYQFQFDGPPQTGAIYTAGFSLCSNGSLALGGSTVFYQCLSGNFYNLYDRYWAAQCQPIELLAQPFAATTTEGSSPTGLTGGSGPDASASSNTKSGHRSGSKSSAAPTGSLTPTGDSTVPTVSKVTGASRVTASTAPSTSPSSNAADQAGVMVQGVVMIAGFAALAFA